MTLPWDNTNEGFTQYEEENLIQNGDAETGDTSNWDTTDTSVISGGLDGNYCFQVQPGGYMSQERSEVEFAVVPRGFRLQAEFAFDDSPPVLSALVKFIGIIKLTYFDGSYDKYTFSLVETFDEPEEDGDGYSWYSFEGEAPVREDAILTNIEIEFRVDPNSSTNCLVNNIRVQRTVTDLDRHEHNDQPHELPLDISVNQDGIKGAIEPYEEENIRFWLKSEGEFLFQDEDGNRLELTGGDLIFETSGSFYVGVEGNYMEFDGNTLEIELSDYFRVGIEESYIEFSQDTLSIILDDGGIFEVGSNNDYIHFDGSNLEIELSNYFRVGIDDNYMEFDGTDLNIQLDGTFEVGSGSNRMLYDGNTLEIEIDGYLSIGTTGNRILWDGNTLEVIGTIDASDIIGSAMSGGTITGTIFRTDDPGNVRLELTDNRLTTYWSDDSKEGVSIEEIDGFFGTYFFRGGDLKGGLTLDDETLWLYTSDGNDIVIGAEGVLELYSSFDHVEFTSAVEFVGSSVDFSDTTTYGIHARFA